LNDYAARESRDDNTELLDVEFPARAMHLKETRGAVREALSAAGCDDDVAGDVVIAIDEACQNIIRHAYGGDSDQTIRLRLRLDGMEIVVELEDRAAAVDARKIAPRKIEDLRPGGLGTYFMREIMDSVAYNAVPSGRGNLLTMRKTIG
jgi:sigma-B regulation protein RsbU (phosphoserine phosphatase)